MHEPQFPRIGELFVGRYRIDSVVGAGGFSQVYRAKQIDLGRDVAIKVLKPVRDDSKSESEREAKFEQVARRFEREARLISRLKDRNTVIMYDHGRTHDGLLFMVLEYVDGRTVSDLIAETGPLAPDRVVKILEQALTSLHEAHSLGVLHRDIKPGNIMVYEHVGRADQVKVLDFGIAKAVDRSDTGERGHTTSSDVTADGVLVGTPRYMSPEQIRGKTLGPGSDIYSLGLVTFEMLNGTKAVDADSSLRIIARHLDTDPILVPDDLPIPLTLRAIVNRMLLKDPAARYASCDEVLHDLAAWNVDRGVPTRFEPTLTVASSGMKVQTAPAPGPRALLVGIAVLAVAVAAMTVPLLLKESEGTATSVEPPAPARPISVADPTGVPPDPGPPGAEDPVATEDAQDRSDDGEKVAANTVPTKPADSPSETAESTESADNAAVDAAAAQVNAEEPAAKPEPRRKKQRPRPRRKERQKVQEKPKPVLKPFPLE